MNSIERNDIFMDNVGMIRRVMRRNWALICAMRLAVRHQHQQLYILATPGQPLRHITQSGPVAVAASGGYIHHAVTVIPVDGVKLRIGV